MEARDATAATGAPGRMDPARPLVAARPRYGEKVIQALLAACALISVITTTVIVISLLSPTLNFFEEVGFGKFFSLDEWAPTQAEPTFGALRLVIGTLSATLWALLFAVPIGLLSGIYLSEYARPRVRKTVKPVLEVLAAGANPNASFNPFESVLTMTASIARVATGDIGTGTITYDTIFAVGSLLFVMTLGMNAIAMRLVRRFREV